MRHLVFFLLGSWSIPLRAEEAPSELPPRLFWQEFRLPAPEDCAELQKALQLLAIPSNLNTRDVAAWSMISCASNPLTDRVSIAQYFESYNRAGDAPVRSYLELLDSLHFRGERLRVSAVKEVVALNSLWLHSKEGIAEPWKSEWRRASSFPSYVKAVQGFSRQAKGFVANPAADFLAFLESFLSSAYDFRLVLESSLPETGELRLEAEHFVILEDGRSLPVPQRPFFERKCAEQACR